MKAKRFEKFVDANGILTKLDQNPLTAIEFVPAVLMSPAGDAAGARITIAHLYGAPFPGAFPCSQPQGPIGGMPLQPSAGRQQLPYF